MVDGHGTRLDSILSHLGGTLLEEVAGRVHPTAVFTDVVIDDRRDDEPLRPGAVLLCAGADEGDVPELVERAAVNRAAAVVVRGPVVLDAETRTAVENSGVALLALARGATWAQLAVLLRSLLTTSVGADVDRQVRADLVATALAAGPAAPEAIERLRLARRQVAVMGMAIPGTGGTANAPTSRQVLKRTSDALAFHLSVVAPGSVAALVGDVCYAVIPGPAAAGGSGGLPEKAQRVAEDLLRRSQDGLGGAVLGVARPGVASAGSRMFRSRRCYWRSGMFSTTRVVFSPDRSSVCAPTIGRTAPFCSIPCPPGWTVRGTFSAPRPRWMCIRTPSGTGSGGRRRSPRWT